MTWKLHVKSLNTLLKIEPELDKADERTLTVYLPIRAEGYDATHYDLYLNHLVDPYLDRLDEDSLAVFESEMARLRTHLNVVRPAGCPAIVAFANEPQKILRLIRLPESVDGRIEVGLPLLAPLELILAHHPPALVVVAQKEEARLFASVLGEVVPLEHLKGEEVKRSRAGGTSAMSNQRKADNRVRANLKRVVQILETEMRRKEFGRIFVAGPEEARAELVHELPKAIAADFAGTLSLAEYSTPGQIQTAIRDQLAHRGSVSPAA